MKKLIVIFTLTFLSTSLYSQKGSDSLLISQFNIKTSPLTIIDPLTSAAQIALEYRHKQKFAIEVSYNIHTPNFTTSMKGKENEKLLKYKGEVKYFFQDEIYMALEYGYINYAYDYKDDYYTPNTQDDPTTLEVEFPIVHSYESASFNKIAQVFDLKFGIEFNSRKYPRLMFDVFTGVGVRFVDVNYTNVVNPLPVSVYSTAIDRQVPAWDLNVGKTTRGNFTFGIKIGYTLWSKY